MNFIVLFGSLAFIGLISCQNFNPQWVSDGGYNYYIIYSIPGYSFQEARDLCHSKDSELASVTSERENIFLQDAIGVAHLNYWIGLEKLRCDPADPDSEACTVCRTFGDCRADNTSPACIACRKLWFWTDGTPMLDGNGDFIYENWNFEKPYGLNDRHIAFLFSGVGTWNDVSDNSKVPGVICKKASACSSNPCNNGHCIDTFIDGENKFQCDCRCSGGPLYCDY